MSSGIIDKNNLYFNRRSIRLKNYDYSRIGTYFITTCTNERENMFGEITNDKMILNEYGKIANLCWIEILEHFPDVELDEYVIMPNHIHGIIFIERSTPVGANNYSPQSLSNEKRSRGTSKTIGSIIRGFKIGVTKWFRKNTSRKTIWQRNYYEHIIRNKDELNRIREYIINNPVRWDEDEYNSCREKNCNP